MTDVLPFKQPFSREEHEHFALRAHTALWEMLEGVAGKKEWQDLMVVMNVLEALIAQKNHAVPVDPYRKLVEVSVEGILYAQAHAHSAAAGPYRMHAKELYALRHAVLKYDEIMGRLARGVLMRASEHITFRLPDLLPE